MCDIRLKTRLIVKRGSEYLVARDCFGNLVFSSSPYDAWATRNREYAKWVSYRIGGDLWLFNPIVSALRKYEEG